MTPNKQDLLDAIKLVYDIRANLFSNDNSELGNRIWSYLSRVETTID